MKLKGSTLRFMFGASLMALTAGAAHAQAPAANTTTAAPEENGEVIVVGARRAEQTSIQRKKRASTVVDSIVADDVGNFPDKNAAEAIARISGVALDVDSNGESGGLTIRGQTADLIRVEVDGMTTLDNSGGAGGRSAQLNEVSSDLIKSVDVIKGQTADMTPGGVGGTVRIETRTGLDFKKPLYRLNIQGQMNTLDSKVTPRIGLIATRKFLDDRLGIMFNLTYDDVFATVDKANVTEGNDGYLPLGDHDNSPEKTFTTPYDAVAAAVTTKAGCAALSNSTANGATNSRRNCYAQWEDYMPTLPRYFRRENQDKRLSVQLRADFRVNDNLTVFASYQPNTRESYVKEYQVQIGLPSSGRITGQIGDNGLNTGVNFVANKVNENHYVTDYSLIVNAPGTNVTTASGGVNLMKQVRETERNYQQDYFQTGFDFKDGPWTAKARIQYSAASQENEQLAFTMYTPLQRVDFSMVPESGLWTFALPANEADPAANLPAYNTTTGMSSLSPLPQLEYTPQADKNTEWNYQLDITRQFDDLGPLKDIKLGIQKRNRQNLTSREGAVGNIVPGTPAVTLSRARALDRLMYCVPSATVTCNYGSVRRTDSTGQSNENLLYKDHVITQAQYQALIQASLMDLPGGQFFNGLPERGDLLNSFTTFDIQVLRAELSKIADLSNYNLNCLYNCIASNGQTYDRPTFASGEKTVSAYVMADFEWQTFGLDTTANLGVRFQSIAINSSPVINFYNRTAVPVTIPAAGAVPARNTYATQDTIVQRRVGKVDRRVEDVLPSLNVAIWPIQDQVVARYSAALQRARPSLTQMTGSDVVNCYKTDPAQIEALKAAFDANPALFDDGNAATSDDQEESAFFGSAYVNRCSGTIGNPELEGYQALTQNLSAEWYPNKDTQFSVAVYSLNVKIDRPVTTSLSNYNLEDNEYFVGSWVDGPRGRVTKGYEIAGRTAFTYLPWLLKYTGGGFNFSQAESTQDNLRVDLITGTALPPKGESDYYYNVNFWYDDGRLSARVAYQARDVYFDRMVPSANNRVPVSETQSVDGGASTANYFKMVTPVFRSKTETLDARASYKLSERLSFFVEGKNLLDNAGQRFAPSDYRQIDDQGTPYIYDSSFTGRKYYFGLILTY